MFRAFMARPWVSAVLLQGFIASSLNLTSWDVSANGETSRLLRREQHRFKLWEEAVEAATGDQVAPSFRPEIRRCNYSKADAQAARLLATPRRSQTQRALREVKEVLARHQVPLILIGGLALGYYNSCAAMVGNGDRVVATFGPWLEEAGLSSLSSSFEQRGHRLDLRHCKAGPMNAGCKLSVTLCSFQLPLLQWHDHRDTSLRVLPAVASDVRSAAWPTRNGPSPPRNKTVSFRAQFLCETLFWRPG